MGRAQALAGLCRRQLRRRPARRRHARDGGARQGGRLRGGQHRHRAGRPRQHHPAGAGRAAVGRAQCNHRVEQPQRLDPAARLGPGLAHVRRWRERPDQLVGRHAHAGRGQHFAGIARRLGHERDRGIGACHALPAGPREPVRATDRHPLEGRRAGAGGNHQARVGGQSDVHAVPVFQARQPARREPHLRGQRCLPQRGRPAGHAGGHVAQLHRGRTAHQRTARLTHAARRVGAWQEGDRRPARERRVQGRPDGGRAMGAGP
ncbi:hypothetical protein D3C85_983230 [compost metagenome]